MQLTGSQIIVKLLEKQGIKQVSGIPGGSILPLYDELAKSSIQHILVRQEQAAGFIAQGVARSTGEVAVCFATSGPGAMNLLTAIADARSDSIPMVIITGQVNSVLIGTDAFQEADTFGLSFPITKHSAMVKKVEDLFTLIPAAFKIAVSGRPGPVLIDIPRDIQTAVYNCDNFPEPKEISLYSQKFFTKEDELKDCIDSFCTTLCSSKKPILYVGGGCNSPEVSAAVVDLLKIYPMPVVSSLMGIGVVSSTAPEYTGMVGMHGSFSANKLMFEADTVFAAGAHFDDRAIGLAKGFCPNAKILHIDIDSAEINKIYSAEDAIVGDCKKIIPLITSALKTKAPNDEKFQHNKKAREEWLNNAKTLRKNHNSYGIGSSKTDKYPNPRQFIAELPSFAQKMNISEDNLIVTTDVGQHQMWVAQYYPIQKTRTLLTSGSLGTMGFGLPSAIGAALANKGKRVVCFSGDGSILMNIQELATLSDLNLPVTIVVFQNGTLGMVRQQQKYLYSKNYSASIFINNPDFLTIARGFGIDSVCANDDEKWYEKAFASEKPCFVVVRIDPEEDVLPYVKAGKANIDALT